MKLQRLGSVLRNHSLPSVIGEVAWRGIRSIRKSSLILAGGTGGCPVSFRPIGYYARQSQPVSKQGSDAILAYADQVLRGVYPLMGYGCADLGLNPDWQCDWVSGKSWPLIASRKITTVRLDGSDVKAPWELSRLQWSPVVAKAFKLTGDRKYREGLRSLLTNWVVRNPAGTGVNWTVAMEASLRSISLCLTMDLLWPFSDDEKLWLDQMTASLWQHLRFIETHSEFSFLLRSNHYLSNIVGLTTLSAYLHGPGMQRRFRKNAAAVNREILLQTYPDGGDCEASTGYHVLVAQMFLHSLVVQQQSGGVMAPQFEARLRLMFQWIATLVDENWNLPHLGDCDNGRVELLCDDLAQTMRPAAQRHSLVVRSLCGLASHLLPPGLGEERKPITLLRDSGIAVLREGEAAAVFCAMPNGLRGKGSHTHCDKLSVVFRLGTDEVFCDSGSRSYTRSAQRRNLDRSTMAHNTLTVDGAEQNTVSSNPRLLFQAGNEAVVSRIEMADGGVRASHQGYSRYGIAHQRTVQLSQGSLEVLDEVSGAGEHLLDMRYILGPEWYVSPERTAGEAVNCVIAGPRQLTLQCKAAHSLVLSVTPAEISREYGAGLAATCIRIHTNAGLPARVQTKVQWD